MARCPTCGANRPPQSHESGLFNEHGDELRERLEAVLVVYAENRKADSSDSAGGEGTLTWLYSFQII